MRAVTVAAGPIVVGVVSGPRCCSRVRAARAIHQCPVVTVAPRATLGQLGPPDMPARHTLEGLALAAMREPVARRATLVMAIPVVTPKPAV